MLKFLGERQYKQNNIFDSLKKKKKRKDKQISLGVIG